MNDPTRLQGRQPLPLPHADRSQPRLTLSGALEPLPPAEALLLLIEARRALMPGGRLEIVASAELDLAAIRHFADLLGLTPAPAEADGATAAWIKPARGVDGEPRVSIAIPAYSPRFFEAALTSALNQSYDNLDVVVCDDSPDAGIGEICQRLQRLRRFRYLRNPTRLKGRANYARCLDEAEGEFLKYLNHDDVLAPDCVERLVDAFRRAPDIALATSYRARVDEHGAPLPDQPATRPLVESDSILHGASLLNVMLMAGLNVVGEPSTTMFRKADLIVGKPDYFCFDGVVARGVIDMAMWSTLLLRGDAVYLRAPLSQFRIHADQQQQDPAIRQLGMQGIRNLQEVWLRLGLHAAFRRDQFLGRPFPDDGGGWRALPFTPVPQPPPTRLWNFS